MKCYHEFNKPLLPYQFKGFIKVLPTTSCITIIIDNETEQIFLDEDQLLEHQSQDRGFIAVDFQTTTHYLHPAYADDEDLYIFNNVKCQHYMLKAQVQTNPLKLDKVTPYEFSELDIWRRNYNALDLLFLYVLTSCNKLYKIPFEVFLDLDKYKCEFNQKPIPITLSKGIKYTIINDQVQKVMTNTDLSNSFAELESCLLTLNRLMLSFRENYDVLL